MTLLTLMRWSIFSQATTFVHMDEISCEYRIFSDTEIQSCTQVHEDKGYLDHAQKVITSILKNLELSHFEQIIDLVNHLEKQQQLLTTQLSEQTQQRQALAQQLEQFHSLEQLLADTCAAVGIEAAGRQGIAQLIGRTLPQQTLFSIILPVYNTEAAILRQTLLSVRNQAYTGWELCLVDDASDREETRQVLQAVQNNPVLAKRLHYLRRDTQGGIVAASNDAIKMATAPYIAFLDHDDNLHHEALLSLALKLQQQDYTLLYTDSRMIDHSGQPMHTYQKADWSPETLLHINYINHLTVVKREILKDGLRADFNGAQDWDLLLQLVDLPDEQVCHIRQPLYDWRATEGSVAYQADEKTYAFEAAQSVLTSHLKEVSVTANKKGVGFVCQWRSPMEPIDIIIPTHNNLSGLKTCLNGLFQLTDYPQFNIIVVANRSPAPVHDYLNSLGQIKILVNDDVFNWSTLNNQAVISGESPILLFLNDEIEIKLDSWLRDLRRYLSLDGVGAVGATLFYPNGDLQHNGIETNPQWVARNIANWGIIHEISATRNVSAVTGACLLTRRSVWQQVGGFDEKLAVSYNDVDFCLAIRRQGLRIVQATDVELILHEHGTVDNPEALIRKEINLMREKWGEFLTERYMPRYDIQAQKTRILHLK
jgi:GT2 family glycosyltransferase